MYNLLHTPDGRANRVATITFDVLRIVAGLLFAQHGVQKLFGLLGGVDGNGATAPLGSIFGVAGVLELVGGLLLASGFLTRPVAFLLSGQMAVAYFMMHAGQGFWPILNQGELAALYSFVFLFFAAAGAGPWSLDALVRRPHGREVARVERPAAREAA